MRFGMPWNVQVLFRRERLALRAADKLSTSAAADAEAAADLPRAAARVARGLSRFNAR